MFIVRHDRRLFHASYIQVYHLSLRVGDESTSDRRFRFFILLSSSGEFLGSDLPAYFPPCEINSNKRSHPLTRPNYSFPSTASRCSSLIHPFARSIKANQPSEPHSQSHLRITIGPLFDTTNPNKPLSTVCSPKPQKTKPIQTKIVVYVLKSSRDP
jgi:hypothetical protein